MDLPEEYIIGSIETTALQVAEGEAKSDFETMPLTPFVVGEWVYPLGVTALYHLPEDKPLLKKMLIQTGNQPESVIESCTKHCMGLVERVLPPEFIGSRGDIISEAVEETLEDIDSSAGLLVPYRLVGVLAVYTTESQPFADIGISRSFLASLAPRLTVRPTQEEWERADSIRKALVAEHRETRPLGPFVEHELDQIGASDEELTDEEYGKLLARGVVSLLTLPSYVVDGSFRTRLFQ